MHRTGTLSVDNGISRLDSTRLARTGANKPLEAATNFLALRNLDDGDFIFVEGTDGSLNDSQGTVPVIFITDAGLVQTALVLMPAVGVKAAGKKAAGGKKGGAKKAGSAKKSAKKPAGKRSKKGSGK